MELMPGQPAPPRTLRRCHPRTWSRTWKNYPSSHGPMASSSQCRRTAYVPAATMPQSREIEKNWYAFWKKQGRKWNCGLQPRSKSPVCAAGSTGRCNTIWYKADFKGGVYDPRETIGTFCRADDEQVWPLE